MITKSINSGFHHLFRFHVDRSLLEITLFQFFCNLGTNLIALSLPFYLYQNLEYQVWQICVFFLAWQTAFVLIIPFVGTFIERFGLKHSMGFQSFATALFWIVLPFLVQGELWMDLLRMAPFFLLRASAVGVSEVSYDIFLTHHMDDASRGKTIAWIQIAIMATVIMAPFLGGLITYFIGFEWTAVVAFVAFLISGIVLLFTPDEKFHVPYTPKELLRDTFKRDSRSVFVAEGGRVFFDAILWLVWPIFLILILKNIVTMGILVGISSGISMMLIYCIGRRIDQGGVSEKTLRFGSYRSTVLNFLRGILWDPFLLAIVDVLHKINFDTLKVSYDVQMQRWLRRRNTFERAHIRWMIVENIYMLAVAFFTILFILFQESTQIIFIIIFCVGSLANLGIQAISNSRE
ncbi:MFS transporter [Candidatus Gracilibacteria bacterium]|nr:MFS transporter [Candidatus Gracilibacteria bacterium]